MNFNLQNMWLYAFNILFNLVILLLTEPTDIMPANFFRGYASLILWLIILLTAAGGFSAALILKHLSTIMKEYGSSLIMVCSTLGTVYILKEKELRLETILSIGIVSGSLYLYNYDQIYPAPKQEPESKV